MPSDVTVSFVAAAVEVVRTVASQEILPRYRSVDATRKADGSIVTEADFAAQDALVRKLRAVEDVPMVGEEMTQREQHAAFERGGRFWCIDPLDGTSNFAKGVPFFSVSVALMEGARPIFGVVYNPIADEAFFAARGAGAWLNHKPLLLRGDAPRLSEAVAEVSLRSDTRSLSAALKHRKPYRKRLTQGSSALSWCELAAGRVDVMLHGGQKMWDYAAGALVLDEAGGCLSALEQDDFWSAPLWKRSVIAARSHTLLDEWRGWLRAAMADQ